jgi:NAD(P)-dependent dehydrogenase (short-subunit alcohol dehydrogenase family)
VTDPDAARQVADRALEAFGQVDVLVNNAGVGMRPPVLEPRDPSAPPPDVPFEVQTP